MKQKTTSTLFDESQDGVIDPVGKLMFTKINTLLRHLPLTSYYQQNKLNRLSSHNNAELKYGHSLILDDY